MLIEKQISLFEALRLQRDKWVDISLIKLESEVEKLNIKEQQNEIIESVIYSILEMIDGYDDNLNFNLDLIDKETNMSLKAGIELHDKFIDYITEIDSKS
jgi:hypothetical protein